MKLVYSEKLPKLHILRKITAFFLVTLLAACGTQSVTVSSPQPQSKGIIKGSTITPASLLSTDPLRPNTTPINVKEGDLLIQSSGGFQCPVGGFEQWANRLVLASNRTSYSEDEIQHMRDYLGSNATTLLESPSTLHWELGGSIVPIPGTAPVAPEIPCGTIFELTNTGSAPIQIPRVGVQLEMRPQPNRHQYHLINYCSLIPSSQGCYSPFGGGAICSSYAASIQLGLGVQNDEFSTVPLVPGEANCGILTIAPNDQTTLTIDLLLTPHTPKNLIYSILPIFTVDTAQGVQKLSLSHLISTLAFASASQFSCYTLQGTTFALETPALISSLRWNWCM